MCCCFSESGENYKLEEVYCEKLTRDEIANKLEDESKMKTWLIRLGGFLMHFLGVYLILYPFILLIGMIPFLGAIGATVLVFFAFIFSLITFLFIIACSWICARPLLAFLIYGFILVLFVVGKISKENLDKDKEHKKFGDNSGFKNPSRKLLRGFFSHMM